MRKKLAKTVTAVAMITLLTSASVLAETHTITNFTVTSGGGWKTVSDSNTKVDNEQNAYVTITSRSNASTIYAKVKRGSVACTDENAITKTGKRNQIPYTKSVKKGDVMKVQFQATTQNQTISGRWTS